MGYTTDFRGQFDISTRLDTDTQTLLTKLNETRRMARKLGPEYGIEGEFYVDGKGSFGQDREDSVIEYNRPPSTQPSLWCQWRPTKDGLHIEWDGGEKFYSYVEWIEYIINKILAPRGYFLTGIVEWRGEDWDDVGAIHIKNNVVTATRNAA